ncbi:MAG: hypothetical protein ACLFRN_12190 [Halothece sp.]
MSQLERKGFNFTILVASLVENLSAIAPLKNDPLTIAVNLAGN